MKKLRTSLPRFQKARYYSRKAIDYYFITRLEWENLKNDIKKIVTTSLALGKLAFLLIGFAPTFFVGFVTCPKTIILSGVPAKYICLTLFIIAIIGIIILIFSSKKSDQKGRKSKKDIINTMEQIEKDLIPPTQEDADESMRVIDIFK